MEGLPRLRLVDAVDLPAAHAVDHGDAANGPALPAQLGLPTPLLSHQPDQLGQSDDLGQITVAVLACCRLVVVEAGGHDDDARVHREARRLRGQVDSMPGGLGALATPRAGLPVDGRDGWAALSRPSIAAVDWESC